jgi:large subunit ribosomal protein L17
MKHKMKGRRLGRSPSHRQALMRNMAATLFAHDQIITTEAKAKELRPFAERLITLAKKAALALESAASLDGEEKRVAKARSLHYRRRLIQLLGGKKRIDVKGTPIDVVGEKLIDEIGPLFKDRPGGYTRIIKRTQRRLGDAAPTAILALVRDPLNQKQSASVAPAVSSEG